MGQVAPDSVSSRSPSSWRSSKASVVAGVVAAAFAGLVQLAGCSNGDSCVPAPGSCDLGAPTLSPFDDTQNCLGSPVQLTAVCNTSLNRCFMSAGLGAACAVAPDGRVYVGDLSDNDLLTAAGWHFDEPTSPPSSGVPSDEMLTEEQVTRCRQASSAPPCAR